jgi:uncharacterized membrane protein YdcZ (DUF606 family)
MWSYRRVAGLSVQRIGWDVAGGFLAAWVIVTASCSPSSRHYGKAVTVILPGLSGCLLAGYSGDCAGFALWLYPRRCCSAG